MRDKVHWGVFLLVAVGTTSYIYMFAQTVAAEQEAFVNNVVSIDLSSTREIVMKEDTASDMVNEDEIEGMTATMTTNKGEIVLELFEDKAPKTVENFVKLANEGFYNGIKFHRVIPNFMIQGGDPLTKDDAQMMAWGTGGPGYTFEDEIHDENQNMIGTLAMANAGPNTNGSQFFINTADNNFLDTKHTVFGRVVTGMDVVLAIQEVETTQPGRLDRPVEPIVIESLTINE